MAGVEDLGRFVNNTEHFAPSQFDERAAMPVLLDILPTATDAKLVEAIAGHLRRPWARPAAFPALRDAFERWAPTEPLAGWALGDALANAARRDDLSALLAIAGDARYGMCRQMIVYALPRFKASRDVEPALVALLDDPDVALHAMSALRRSIGAEAALPHLRQIEAAHSGDSLGDTARREIRKAVKSLERAT